jgi:hypothetical protein
MVRADLLHTRLHPRRTPSTPQLAEQLSGTLRNALDTAQGKVQVGGEVSFSSATGWWRPPRLPPMRKSAASLLLCQPLDVPLPPFAPRSCGGWTMRAARTWRATCAPSPS